MGLNCILAEQTTLGPNKDPDAHLPGLFVDFRELGYNQALIEWARA